jgi:mannose-1-phosphate guanylyltransferase/mannose-6-phosphate isomerase
MDLIAPVILCGGSGTRLRPFSRKSLPNQFVPLIANKSLLQLTLERVSWGRPDVALFKFTKAILAGDPIQVFNYGKHRHDFT